MEAVKGENLMYSPPHAAAAIIILVLPVIPMEYKIPAAILSHAVVDMIGEAGVKNNWRLDSILLGLLCLVGLWFSYFWIAVLGIFLGNLLDVLDMRYKDGQWSKSGGIHNQGRIKLFGISLWYPPVIYQLKDDVTTVKWNIGFTVAAIVFMALVATGIIW